MDLLTHHGASNQAGRSAEFRDSNALAFENKVSNQQLPLQQPAQSDCFFSFKNGSKGGGVLGTSQPLSMGQSNCNNTLNVTSMGSNPIQHNCLFDAQSSMSDLEKILKEGYQNHHQQ